MDGAQEVGGPLVVAGGDRPVLLQLGEEVLDQVARLVEILVVGAGVLAVGLGRDHRRPAGPSEGLEHPLLGVEGLVGDQRLGPEVGQQRVRPGEVVLLPRAEREAGRVAERVDGGVDLRARAAPAAPDGLVARSPFFAAPAPCWWARTTVLSIIAYSLSASPAKCLRTLSRTPVLAQRPRGVGPFSRPPTRPGGPRHGIPAR